MRYLVLLEQKLQDETVSELRTMDSQEAEFHVLVPARPLSEEEKEFVALEVAGSPDEDEEGDETAVLARWQIGSARPISPVVTSRPGIAGWLHLDTASKLERRLDIPVHHIEASAPQEA